jgi:L-2-hydroxyglutarate oxidase LhgO
VGLAVARALARGGREVLVLERNPRIGDETSARNSGVIHSGIYYPPGSLKATLCVRGRRLLYDYCAARGIAHRRCGKLVVARAAQTTALERLMQQGIANGVDNLEMIDGREAARLEPALRCDAALASPDTGILDVPEFATSLCADIEAAGGYVSLRTSVTAARPEANGFCLDTVAGPDASRLRCRTLVNAAGLSAAALLQRIEGYPPGLIPRMYYAKGNYFACRGRSAFNRLVYPMPNEAGLGIHLTLGLDGRARFGPDVEWVDGPAYDVDGARVADFRKAIREYWPALPDDALAPDFAGVRPKLVGPGAPAADFRIDGPGAHGLPGLVVLLGIESPGITSSLALAEHVLAEAG